MKIIKSLNLRKILTESGIAWYLFLAVMVKNIIFVGFMIDEFYLKPHLKDGVKYIFRIYGYRVLYYIGFALILIVPIFLFKNKKRIIAVIVINVLFSMLLLTYLWYLRGFSAIPNVSTLKSGSNISDSMSSILAIIRKIDIIFIADIPLFIMAFIVGVRYKVFKENNRRVFTSAGILAVALIFIIVLAPLVNRPLFNKSGKRFHMEIFS